IFFNYNTSLAQEQFWFKGSNGSWLYKSTISSSYTSSANEWATISVGAVYYRNAYWGKQRARVFSRIDAVENDYPYATDIKVVGLKSALKDINGPNNTYDSLTITSAYPSHQIPSETGVEILYDLAGYIWNDAPMILNIIANGFGSTDVNHWHDAAFPERHQRILVSNNYGLSKVDMPLIDNYGYPIPHNQADRYAEWFNVNGFTSTIIYNLPDYINKKYKLRAWGQALYDITYEGEGGLTLTVQSAYPTVDYYVHDY
ncbi:MAG: hypothetical protein MJA82_00005, partial [Clostridia bacterium]|nr:hypothetical protein [Clostridia bacterium]